MGKDINEWREMKDPKSCHRLQVTGRVEGRYMENKSRSGENNVVEMRG